MPVPETETLTLHLIIPRRRNSEIALTQEREKYALPQIEIPKWQRIAENLTSRVKDKWNLEAICLFNPTWDNEITPELTRCYQVLELRDPAWRPPDDFQWLNRDALSGTQFSCPEDLDVLQSSLRQADAYNSGTQPGPFARAGWLDELMRWMQHHLCRLNLSLTGTPKQFNASPFFSLIRFETNGPALWFKAVGEPNLHEFGITTALSRMHPQYFPKIIAARPECHGWLMEEANGPDLGDVKDAEYWQNAARTLASLQMDFSGRTLELLPAGCKDRRIPELIKAIDPFLEAVAELMQQQLKAPPPILTRQELLWLGKVLKDACHRLRDIGIADSLGHCDFNPGNVLVTPEGCLFIDWTEAYVGPPFATLEYLLAHLRRSRPESESQQDSLRRAYSECWKTRLTSDQISEALTLTPLLAVLIYALAGDSWRDPQRPRNPEFAKYVRSLARRMHREAQNLLTSEVSCAN